MGSWTGAGCISIVVSFLDKYIISSEFEPWFMREQNGIVYKENGGRKSRSIQLRGQWSGSSRTDPVFRPFSPDAFDEGSRSGHATLSSPSS